MRQTRYASFAATGVGMRWRRPAYAAWWRLDVRRTGTFVVASLALLSVLVLSGSSSAASTVVAASSTVVAVASPYRGSPAHGGAAVVSVAVAPGGSGYYVLRADGEVSAYGVPTFGSVAARALTGGVTATGIAVDPRTAGYWVVLSNGMVLAFHAPFRGEVHFPAGGWGQYPAAVGIAALPNGRGYDVLRANGAVASFGGVVYGTLAGRLRYGATAPVVAVALAVDPLTGGYWIATSDGVVTGFHVPGPSRQLARNAHVGLASPITAMTSLADGRGYDMVDAGGQVVQGLASGVLRTLGEVPPPPGASASALAGDALTGGYYVGFDATGFGGYANPLRDTNALVPQEIDQGVDYCGSGPVYAVGEGVVVNLYSSGWPSGVFVSYRLVSGPARGRYVYVAENVTPEVHLGERVNSSTIVAMVHDAKTCMETGWADPPSRLAFAAGHAQFDGRNSTAFGLNFSALLQRLGARPGLPQPYGAPGSLPVAWPTW